MALFKILRGGSSDLTAIALNDGYAYFTPDNGRFYIDVDFTNITGANGQPLVPANYVKVDTTNSHLYRIELRPSAAASADALNPATFGNLYVKNVEIDTANDQLVVTMGNNTVIRENLAYSSVRLKTWTSSDVAQA